MSSILPAIPFVIGSPGPSVDVSTVAPEFRTLIWVPTTVSDQVVFEGSADGGTSWATRASLGSLPQIQRIDDCTTLYRARRTAGTGGKLHLVGEAIGSGSSPQVIEMTVTHADLVAAAVSQSFNFGSPIPLGAVVLGVSADLGARFLGGGATTAVFQIGTAVDPDSIVSSCDVFNAPVDGQASALSYGIAPNRFFAAATQLLLTFVSDVNVVDLTAGSITARLTYCIPF